MTDPWDNLKSIALEEVEETISLLPEPLQVKARELPVTLQPRPNAEQLVDGLEPDILGLFVGDAYENADNSLVPLPAQIILFLENLWEFSEQDEEIYREELHTTYLHELGHYLGLDEDDLYDRGLE